MIENMLSMQAEKLSSGQIILNRILYIWAEF